MTIPYNYAKVLAVVVNILILLLACCWGPSFVLMKIGVQEVPPLLLLTVRLGLAALPLLIICKINKRKVFALNRLPHFLVMGLFSGALPFFLIIQSQLLISSSTAAVINGSVPIFVLVASALISLERVTFQKVVGIMLGLVGLLVIFIPRLAGEVGSLQGILMVLISSICYAIGIVYGRKMIKGWEPLVGPTGQLTVATILLLPLCLFQHSPFLFEMPSMQASLSILTLSLWSTTVGFIIFFKLLEIADALRISFVSLFLPVIGILLGTWVLGEESGFDVYLGAALICLGLVATSPLPLKRRLIES